ncbi:MAG: Entericidin EcnA/B family protein [Pseudomonadota bacterium]
MIRTTLTATALGALTLTTTACNTVKGLGRDIESVGEAGEEVISEAPQDGAEVRDAR